ncbi:MAG: HAD-IIIA family hydrolase [Planctomycetota bacterium]
MAKAGTRQALFLGLHGTLLHDWTDREDYVHPRFFEGALEALTRIDPNRLSVFIATNQCEVASGLVRERDFKRLQEAVLQAFDLAGIPLTRIYACLHHPQGKGKWRKESVFRKPNIGMFKMAEQEFDLNLGRSWLVCQSTSDVLAGQRAALGTVLVRTGKAGRDGEFIVEPHFTERDLPAAIRCIQQFELSLTR